MREIVGRVWPYILVGIGLGAGIHGYVPEDFLASFMGADVWWAVPAAVLLGVPMYTNAAGIVPVVEALIGKGAALGTTLAFMMSVIALSAPEILILRKVLRWPLIATFVGVVAAGILLVGYVFNMVLSQGNDSEADRGAGSGVPQLRDHLQRDPRGGPSGRSRSPAGKGYGSRSDRGVRYSADAGRGD